MFYTFFSDFSDDFCDLKNSQNDIPNSPDIFNFSTNLNDSYNTYGKQY